MQIVADTLERMEIMARMPQKGQGNRRIQAQLARLASL